MQPIIVKECNRYIYAIEALRPWSRQ